MTDNTEAVEKLVLILHSNTYCPTVNVGRDLAQAILAAIQAAPLAYVKPKPLEWDGFISGAYRIEVLDGGIANLWFHDAREVAEGEPELLKGGFLTLISMDELKAAAYEDLCNRWGGMVDQ